MAVVSFEQRLRANSGVRVQAWVFCGDHFANCRKPPRVVMLTLENALFRLELFADARAALPGAIRGEKAKTPAVPNNLATNFFCTS